MSKSTGHAALVKAVKKGNLKSVKRLLNDGVDVNATDGINTTCLHLAITCRHIDIVKQLIENGADCDACDNEGMTPLHQAAINGVPEAIEILISRGAKINTLSDQFGTPLAAAAAKTTKSDERDRIECAKILIRNNADVKCYGGEFHSPLQAAAAGGSREMVELMLANEADVDAKGGRHTTALAAAVFTKREELVPVLLEAGASPTVVLPSGDTILSAVSQRLGIKWLEAIMAPHSQTISPKDMGEAARAAARYCNFDNLKMLLSKGATIKAKDSGLRPILFDVIDSPSWTSWNSWNDSSELHSLLVEGQVLIDVDETDAHNTTALAYSIHRERFYYVPALLDAGANPNVVDDNGDTPIILAMKARHCFPTQDLLSRGGALALDIVDFADRGVLYWACYFGFEGMFNTAIEFIRNGGPEMKKRKARECSLALHGAAAAGKNNMLQILLRETLADATFLDRNNWSIRRTAKEYCREGVWIGLLPNPLAELKRPTSWNKQDTHRQVDISDDGLRITLKNPREDAMARSDFCVPAGPYFNPDIYYFEISVENFLIDNSKGAGELSVGFCQEHVPLNRNLSSEFRSWGAGSWGYVSLGLKQGTTIGYGVNFHDWTGFFTKNGSLIETMELDDLKGKVYPVVSFGRGVAAGSSILANFGNKPEVEFQYKPDCLLSDLGHEGRDHSKHVVTTKRKRDLREREDSEDPEGGPQKRKVKPELNTSPEADSQDTGTEAETPYSPRTSQQTEHLPDPKNT